jgi:hypothetical protein
LKEEKRMNGARHQRRTGGRGHAAEVKVGLAIVVGLIVLAGAGYFVYDATQSDDVTPPTVPVGDGGVVLPQDPSLTLLLEDGVWFVENDGNVTMSDIEVRDGANEVICEIGTMSPDDRQACEDAGENQDLVVVGQGPQGQPVEVRSEPAKTLSG